MSGCNKSAVKVTIINTQYVETDAKSFKSVVQRLTGKDSTVETNKQPSCSATKERRMAVEGGGGGGKMFNSVLSRGVSFKDLDRLLKELPPLDELYRLLCTE